MKDTFEELWALENRMHWFDQAVDLYDRKIDILKKHLESLIASNSGQPGRTIRANRGFYFQYWLGAGPFRSEVGLTTDYFSKDHGESNLSPSAVDYFKNQDGMDQGWNKIISRRPGVMDFNDFYKQISSQDLVAYAVCRVSAARDREIKVGIQGNCPFQFFLQWRSTIQQ